MSPANDPPMPDLAFSLNQLGEETTAAELLRARGQTKKIKVISEKKLMDWILALLQHNLAGKADAFSDEEKQELVAQAQAEIAKRMKLEKELDNEKDRRASELRQAQEKLANSQKSTADYEAAIAAYKTQLEQRDKTIEDLQQDNFDLQDELNQKIALLRTTIDEKDRDKEKLQHSLRNQMVRSTGLLEGVIGLDNDYYGGRHQSENPVPESAAQEEQFYHDFDVGSSIMQTLGKDLSRLRGIAKGTGEAQQDGLLEADLALLAQLKSGSLSALDVAQPVAGLVEASESARQEALALERANLEAIGGRGGSTVSAVPDDQGKPAEVIAGVTQVMREIGALLIRERARLGALKSMADEADSARNAGESELESMRAAYDQLVQGLTKKAISADLAVPDDLADASIAPARRVASAQALLDQLGEKAGKHDPALRALETRVATQVRDLGKALASQQQARGLSSKALDLRLDALDRALATTAHDPEASPAVLLEATQGAIDALQVELAQRDEQARKAQADSERLRGERSELARELETSQAALQAAANGTQQLAVLVRDLGRAAFPANAASSGATGSFAIGSSKVTELDHALASQADPAKLAAATQNVLETLRKDANRAQEKFKAAKAEVEHAQGENTALRDRLDTLSHQFADATSRADQLTRSQRELAAALIAAAHGDAALADSAAELSLTLDDQQAGSSDLSAHCKAAVEQLVLRKQALEGELADLRQANDKHQAMIGNLTAQVAALTPSVETLRAELAGERTRAAEQAREAAETAASAKEVIQQLKQQHDARVNELAQLKQADSLLRDEATSLRTRLASAEIANRSFAEALSGLVRASAKDPSLASASKDLEQALADMPGEESIPLAPAAARQVAVAGAALISSLESRGVASAQEIAALRAQVQEREEQIAVLRSVNDAAKVEMAKTQKQLSEQTAEAVETVATAKEAIQSLRDQIGRRDEQLKDLRSKEEQARSGLALAQARLHRADESTRKLAETLSALAQAELATAPELGHLQGVEAARVDLELALSELPAEGEQGVPVSDDLAQRLGETGHQTAVALAERRRRIADTLTKAKADADRLAGETAKLAGELQQNRTATIERDSSLKRTQAELATLRTELRDQAAALASKAQDLSDARTALSAAQVDLDSAAQKAQAQEQQLASTQAELTRAKAELASLLEVQARSVAAEQAQLQLTQAFAALSHWDDDALSELVAAPGSPLARASARLDALGPLNSSQAAAAHRQFLEGVREQLAELATEVGAQRAQAAAQRDEVARMQKELSLAKTALVAREQEFAASKTAADAATRRIAQAESTARDLASAIALAVGDDASSLSKAIADPGKPLGGDTTKACLAAAQALAQRTRSNQELCQRLTTELAQATKQYDQAQQELKATAKRVNAAERETAEARAAEQQIAASATELSRELINATKAMAADSDDATAKRASTALSGFDRLAPGQQIAAATELMPALREVFTTLSIDAAQTKAKISSQKEAHEQALAVVRQELDQVLAANGPLQQELRAAQKEKAALLIELTALRSKAEQLETQVAASGSLLLQAQAELDDLRARGSESSAGTADEVSQLGHQLNVNREAHQQAEAELASMREKLAANEARLARLREEMNQRLAERDQLIADKTREYDELAAQQSDSLALQAKIAALTKDLAQVHEELARYKSAHGDLTGATAQAGDLKKSLKGTEAERESLRTKLRELESEIADKRSELEEAQAALAIKTKEMQILRERKDKEVEAERNSVAILRDAERKLKEENVGLKARVRRLTERS